MSDQRLTELIAEAKRLRYSRRTVLRRAAALGLTAPALGAVLAGTGHVTARAKAPAVQLGGKLNILAGSYFVPEAQTFFDEQTKTWGDENGVEITTDYVNWPDIQAKVAAAVESGAGPDIVELRDTWTYLYYEQMVDLNDLAGTVGEAGGGWYDWAENTVAVDGQYYAIPVGTSSAAFAYRQSYLDEVGAAAFPKTWEELFTVGAQLKAIGKPIGQALGHSTGDPPNFAYSYMWAHGAMEVEDDGKTIAVNKPEFVDALERLIAGWGEAFDETGLSWDDSANNRAFLSDQISATINGSSVYIAAQNAAAGASTTDYEVVVDPADINHADFPEGPAGRFNVLGSWSYGMMKYSENQEAARAFLEWWLAPEQFQPWLEAQKGYIIPALPSYAENPIYTTDPKLAPYLNVVTYGRNKGYAGPANQNAARVSSEYIITDLLAKAIQNNDAQGAVDEAVRLLERVYGR